MLHMRVSSLLGADESGRSYIWRIGHATDTTCGVGSRPASCDPRQLGLQQEKLEHTILCTHVQQGLESLVDRTAALVFLTCQS